MSGRVVMVERMMIVIAMDMLHQCGRFQSIPQSMMVELHFTMNRVLRRSLQLLAMVEVMIHKQVICTRRKLFVFNRRLFIHRADKMSVIIYREKHRVRKRN